MLNDLVRCAAEHFRAEEGFFAGYGLELPQAHRSERMAFEEWLTDSLLGTVFGVIDRTAFSQRLSAWWDRHTLAPEWMAVDMPANPQSPARQKEGVPPTDRGTPVSNLPQEGGILPGRE